MDLSTDYMGLALRNPLVGVRIAAVVHARRRQAAGRRRRRRDRSVLAVRGAAARAGNSSHPARRGERREFPRGAGLLPRRGTRGRRPPQLPRPARAGRRCRRGTCDREPQRRHPRGLDRIRPRDAGRRRSRDRAEHLLPPWRSRDLRPRRRAAPHRRPGARQGRRQRAGRGQAQPLLQLHRRDGTAPRRGRGRRTGAVQSLPAARHRPGATRRCSRA